MSTRTAIIIFFLSLAAFKSYTQTDTEFWFAAPKVTEGHGTGGEPLYLRFATLDLGATITISQPANPAFLPIEITLPANTAHTEVVTAYRLDFMNYDPSTIYNKGILIEATNPISAYYEVGTYLNPDIFALKGRNALGDDFFVPFQNRTYNGNLYGGWDYNPAPYSAIYIVATENNTRVTITPTRAVFPGRAANVPFEVTLNRGQSYAVAPDNYETSGREADNHLGGTRVQSDKPIAITTSDDSVYGLTGCYDLIGDQIVPTSIIGNEYIAMRGQLGAGSEESFYVVATAAGTQVLIDGNEEAVLNAGEMLRWQFTDQIHHIETSEPAYVYHVAGFGCEKGGAILPPVEVCTGSTQVSFTRSKGPPLDPAGERFFLNILVRDGAEGGFVLNGDAGLINAVDFVQVTDDWWAGEFEFDETEVEVGAASLIMNTIDVFHLGIINGGSSSGTMYGYFSDFNIVDVGAYIGGTGGSYQLFGCYGDSFDLVATGGIDYEWIPTTYLDDPFIATPVSTPTETIEYMVIASGACDMVDTAYVNIFLYDPVISLYTIDNATGCAPFTVNVENHSIGVTNYSWRFGDGNTSTANVESFSYTYNNDTDDMQIHDFTLVGRRSFCRDTLISSIIVFPEIEARIANEPLISGCSPVTIAFEDDSRGADNYLWSFGDGNTTTDIEPMHTFHNYGDTDTTYTVVLQTLSRFGCVDYDTVYVHVNPYVRSGFEIDPVAHCNPYELEITNTSVGATIYEWDFDDGEGTFAFDDETIEYYLENLTAFTETFNIQLVVANNYGCSDTLTRQVTLYPYLEASFEPSDVVSDCNPVTIAFDNQSEGALAYHWNFDKEEGSSSEENPEHTFYNPSLVEEAVFNVLLTTTSEYGCVDTISTEITVYPRLEAGFTFEHSSYCAPHEVMIFNNAEGFDNAAGEGSVHWDFGDGNEDYNSDGQVTHTFNNTTGITQVYTITQTVTNPQGCLEVKTKDITIYPEITADFTADVIEGCHPLTVDLTNQSIGESTYHWDFDDGGTSSQENLIRVFNNPSHTDIKEYEIWLTVESIHGCKDSTSTTIQVNPKPMALYSTDEHTGCSPFTVDFTDLSIGGDDSYEWRFGDGTPVSNVMDDVSHTYVQPANAGIGTFTSELEITNSYGCSNIFQKNINVYPDIEAKIVNDDMSVCTPTTITFENNSDGAIEYLWTFDDGSSSALTEPTHTFYNYGDVVVTRTVVLEAISEFGCIDRDTIDIHLSPFVKADFNFDPPAHCNPYPIEITNTSVGATIYEWDFDDGEGTFPFDDETIEYYLENLTAFTETFNIQLVVANNYGCSDTLTRQVTLYPYLEASFEPSAVVADCNPVTIAFDNQSEGALTYHWNFDEEEGSSSEENPEHTFYNPSLVEEAVFNVLLTTTSEYGCVDTISTEITVYPRLEAGFTFEHSSYCAPHKVMIFNNAEGFNNAAGEGSVHWNFGDGNEYPESAAQFTHTFNNTTGVTQVYTITQTVINTQGCEEVKTREITIYPETIADFAITDIGSGCHPLEVTLENTSTNASDFYWDFDDGATSTQPTVTRKFYNNSHTANKEYEITLVAESGDGCINSITRTLVVHPKPKADVHLPVSQGCSPLPVEFVDQSVIADGSYLWIFGDGVDETTSPGNIIHTYINTGVDIETLGSTLIITNQYGCSDTTARNVTIYPGPIADFSVSDVNGCHPLEVTISNNTISATGSTPYTWDYGDGNTSTIDNVEHTHVFRNFDHVLNKEYTIELFAVSEYGCEDYHSVDITVHPVPKSNYTIDEDTGCSPHTVQFTDMSVGGNQSYLWTFDDGQTSTVQGNVANIYTQPHDGGIGSFYPVLQITNVYGCTNQYQNQITVYPHIEANFTANMEGCHPLTVNFENLSLGVDTYQWNFDDGNYSNEVEPENTFFNTSNTIPRFYHVELAVSSQYGCNDNITKPLAVYPKPKVDFQTDITDGCSPLSVVFNNLSVGASQYEWDFDGSVSETSQSQFEHIFENRSAGPNTHNILLAGYNQWGCYREASTTITVYPEVEANFTTATGDFKGCTPLHINFVNQSTLSDEHIWTFGNLAKSTNINPGFTFFNEGSEDILVDIELLAISSYGCRDSVEKEITVYSQPVADFEAIPYSQIFPSRTVTLYNYSSEGDWTYDWIIGDGYSYTTKSIQPFDHTFDWISGAYATRHFEIELLVYNDYCSDDIKQSVTVIAPHPIVGFSPSQAGCPPLEVQFVNESRYGYYFHWDFDDGNYSVEEDPLHVFEKPGVYHVTLKVTGAGGIDSTQQIITVFNPPVADFRVEPEQIRLPYESVRMINLSSLASYYEWDFGDGTMSWDFEPEHFYQNTGTFDITLTVGNDTDPQCFDQITKQDVVLVEDFCKLVFPNAFIPHTDGPSGGHYFIDDPSNHIFHPLYDGIEEYTLEIFNRWGELIFRTNDVNIGWDGYHRDRLVNMDVYVWKVKARCYSGEKIEQTGNVTVIR